MKQVQPHGNIVVMVKLQCSRTTKLVFVAAMWAAGCSGSISVGEGNPAGTNPSVAGPGGGSAPTGSGSGVPGGSTGNTRTGGGGVTGPEVIGGMGAVLPIGPAPATRAARLTHSQWENSVRDLLGLDGSTTFGAALRSDPVQSGFLFDNDTAAMAVDEALWTGYQQAAASAAEFATADASRLAKVVAGDSGNAEALVRALGTRAFRRPLSDAETGDYLALFAQGTSFYDDLPEFTAGTRAVIEALLQSPNFLYRVETSTQVQDGVVPLSSYEVAARLSYTLWNTMPDAELFAAAAADALRDPQEVAAQAQRLLDDPRARQMVSHFHDQLFEVERFGSIRPSESRFPGLPGDFGDLAAEENRRFVRDVVFERHGGYSDLLTSNETFVNGELAEVYGLPGDFGDDFRKVSLDPARRAGVFTQVGFLALNATSVNPDPIHRGVFLARRITCTEIAAPPADIPPLPEQAGRTNRETVSAHTERAGTVCASCHKTMINPLGFPFENFDAIGRSRDTDNGHAVDTHSEAWTGAEHVAVDNGVELSHALADSRAVHECYARHWLEFAYGRARTNQDSGLIAQLGEKSLNAGLPIADMIVELVTSPAFLNRSAQELP